MLADAPLLAFVATTDLDRAKAFYADVLGLAVERTEPGHALILDAHGTELRVSRVPELAPAAHTVLGWFVPDAAATARALADKGIEGVRYPWFEQDEQGLWTSPDGAKVLWFRDPDGNLLSVTQIPA